MVKLVHCVQRGLAQVGQPSDSLHWEPVARDAGEGYSANTNVSISTGPSTVTSPLPGKLNLALPLPSIR